MKQYFAYWGKTQKKDSILLPRYHLLPWHSLDVSACGWLMVIQNRFHAADIFAELGFSREEGARWFAWLLGWHDIGKFARGFQQLFKEVHPELVQPISGRSYTSRHDALGYWLWTNYLRKGWLNGNIDILPPTQTPKNYRETLNILLKTTTGHHGRPPEEEDKGATAFAPEDKEAAQIWLSNFRELFDIDTFPDFFTDKHWQQQLKQQSWLISGLIVLADWMGSNESDFPFVTQPMPLSEYWELALNKAAKALEKIPASSTINNYRSHKDLFPFIDQLTPLQTQAVTCDVSAPGPQLLVLEDVTGAGKTEAALILTHRLMDQGKGDSVYIGLPTMATANAMYTRMSQAYRALFQTDSHPSLILAHGGNKMSPEFSRSIWTGDSKGHHFYSSGEPAASSECNGWFADSRKKSLLAEIGVGTLDQLLMVTMPFKHQSLRLVGMYKKILVLDEVHAYDAYMVRLLEGLLSFHASLGGSAIILSATLPYSLRCKLISAFNNGAGYGPVSLNPDARYPWFTQLTSSRLVENELATREEVKRRVSVQWLTEPQEAYSLIEQLVQQGKCVCWIRNTVDEALESYRYLQDSGVIPQEDLLLFHSRFAFVDRLEIEQCALSWFGKEGASLRRAKVLIATQVVEQSLDIDVDCMISDLAPIDLLIQRAGRLQRHIRNAQGECINSLTDERQPPVLHILAPVWTPDAATGWLGKHLRGSGFVYQDHVCLWRTQAVLRTKGEIRMPEDARELVESVYEERIPAPVGLQRNSDDFFGKLLSQRAAAKQNLLDPAMGYQRSASDYLWSDDVELSTRLSEPSFDLYLARTDETGGLQPYADAPEFAWELSRISVRESLWRKISPSIAHLDNEARDEFMQKTRLKNAQVMLVDKSDSYSKEWGLAG